MVSLEVAEIEKTKANVQFEDVAHLMSGARGKNVYETGDIDAGVWSLGLVAGLIHDIPTCKELAAKIEADAEDMIAATSGLIKNGPQETRARL